MSDSGNDSSSDNASPEPLRRGSSSLDLGILRRAMRWETLVILLVLIVLAALAS